MLNNHVAYTHVENLIRLRSNKREASQEQGMNKDDVIAKVLEDIHFLRDRIAHVKRAKKNLVNPTMLKTYESLLESRESVFAKLTNSAYAREETRFN